MGIGIKGEACGEVAQLPDTVFMSTPFCNAMVAKVWRRSWKRTFGMPALASTRFSILLTLSGEMGPPLGEGERADCRLWREEGGERVAAVGKMRDRFVGRSICRAPQQEIHTDRWFSLSVF
jgi:hypothetical protein